MAFPLKDELLHCFVDLLGVYLCVKHYLNLLSYVGASLVGRARPVMYARAQRADLVRHGENVEVPPRGVQNLLGTGDDGG